MEVIYFMMLECMRAELSRKNKECFESQVRNEIEYKITKYKKISIKIYEKKLDGPAETI